MRLKTYEAKTEEEAKEKATKELGDNYTVLSTKKIHRRHFFSLIRKTVYEITVAVDNDGDATSKKSKDNDELEKYKKMVDELNDKLSKNNELITTLTSDIIEATSNVESKNTDTYENEVLQIIHDTLKAQNVMEPVIQFLLEDLKTVSREELDLNYAVKNVYEKIVQLLGKPEEINVDIYDADRDKVCVFMGPTGVGKTTTIAKLASIFILQKGVNVGLVTADTYRIAAVEQLRVYAEILGVELNVVYDEEGMRTTYNKNKSRYDLLIVDTAGRSHKSDENVEELYDLLSPLENSKKFVVLSLVTNSEDLIEIINTYSAKFDFNLILTKSDETSTLGSILNIAFFTRRVFSYVTNGQNVPDDLQVMDTESIAKQILGLGR